MSEALAIVLRYVRDDWVIQQRLVRIALLVRHPTGHELAREILQVLATSLQITERFLMAAMRDRAAVNTAALDTIMVMFPNLLDIGCF